MGIKYSNLNEISKFANFNNLFLLSNVKKITVWFSVDLSHENSRLLYYSKGLLGTFLIYLITNKYPVVKTSKDQRILFIECNLISGELISFSELRSSINLFGLVGWLHIDIYCKHEENYRNLIFLDNLFKSSYLV